MLDLLHTSGMSDAVPSLVIDLKIGRLVFAIERCLQKYRLVHHENGEFVFLVSLVNRLRIDHRRPVKLFVAIVVANHGEDFVELGVGNERGADPVMNQPGWNFLRVMLAHS